MRPISIGVPSGVPKLTLWYGTEDEQSFVIRGLKTEFPYVRAYGTKYPLTTEEINHLHKITSMVRTWDLGTMKE